MSCTYVSSSSQAWALQRRPVNYRGGYSDRFGDPNERPNPVINRVRHAHACSMRAHMRRSPQIYVHSLTSLRERQT